VEAHAEELRSKAAVYINTDGNGRGFLGVGGSHTLERFVNEVARDVIDPQTKVSVAERARARRVLDSRADDRKELRDRADLRISALGSGSDFTPFLQHLGIASLNLGYGGEDDGGEYHSIYDSFDLYTRFKDPTFEYGIALAQTVGRAELRLAEADVLPFEFTAFADTLGPLRHGGRQALGRDARRDGRGQSPPPRPDLPARSRPQAGGRAALAAAARALHQPGPAPQREGEGGCERQGVRRGLEGAHEPRCPRTRRRPSTPCS
jgi:hypothetical protein